jgi:hypothetical protein
VKHVRCLRHSLQVQSDLPTALLAQDTNSCVTKDKKVQLLHTWFVGVCGLVKLHCTVLIVETGITCCHT